MIKTELVPDPSGKVAPTAERYFASACEYDAKGNIGASEQKRTAFRRCAAARRGFCCE